jgi:hypothetical protein
MGYKNVMNPSKKRVLNLHFLLYIYFQSLSLKYHCFFSKKDIYSSIKVSLNSPKETFCRFQPPTTLAYQTLGTLDRVNGSNCQNKEINRLLKTQILPLHNFDFLEHYQLTPSMEN